MANDQSPIAEGYDEFLRDLKERIRRAQVHAVLAVNRELVLLYWQIGLYSVSGTLVRTAQ